LIATICDDQAGQDEKDNYGVKAKLMPVGPFVTSVGEISKGDMIEDDAERGVTRIRSRYKENGRVT